MWKPTPAEKQKPEPPRPLPLSPPRADANWVVPPPAPPQPVQQALAPQQQEASVAAAPLTFTNACTNGLCPTPVAGATDRWMDSSFTGWKSAANANAGIVTAQYILEDMGAQPVDGTCHLQVPVEPTCLIPMVRITARAVAANGRGTSVTLQSNLRQ